MKSIYKLTLLPLLALASCTQNKGTDTFTLNLSVLSPVGAPALAFYRYANDSKFSTNNNPTMIAGYMSSNNYDVIVLDTTSGINAINAGANYKIASTITFGNFYLQSMSSDGSLDNGETVALFGNQNAIPYKVFTYLYGSDFNFKFVPGVDKAAYTIETGKTPAGDTVDWVFIAEPYLYNLKNRGVSATNNPVIDIQEKYRSKNNNLDLMQASVFVSNKANKDYIDSFLVNLALQINAGLASPSYVKENLNKMSSLEECQAKYGVSADIAEAVLTTNSIGLGYKSAKENKEAIDSYISLFGMEVTSEEIYY